MTYIKYITILSILLSSIPAYADWICQETASLKEGQNVLSCGVGEGKTEALARENALNNAKKEFHALCQEDINCKGFKTTVTPLRNSCEKIPSGYKCYRGIDYQITKIKASQAELEDIEKELARKQKEYEEAKKLYEKQKELDELKKKIANKDFKDTPSEWNNFLFVGFQLGFAAIYADNFSISDLSTTFVAQYIPKSRWGVQLKSYNFDVNDNSPTIDNYYNSTTALGYKANGSIRTISFLYYLNDLKINSPNSGFIGIGKGKASFDYTYIFQGGISYTQQEETSKADVDVNVFTLGYNSSNLFAKQGMMGVGFGIDYYSFNSSTPHHLESLMDIYFSLMWGF